MGNSSKNQAFAACGGLELADQYGPPRATLPSAGVAGPPHAAKY
jgi:hypothetical protein